MMTKSIVSTPIQLDVKLRVAQGRNPERGLSLLPTILVINNYGFVEFINHTSSNILSEILKEMDMDMEPIPG